jgi:DNA-binding NtrC family response regulator
MQRAAIAGDDPQILPSHIDIPGVTDSPESFQDPPKFRAARAERLARFEKAYIADLLHKHKGNVTQAAREAGKERRAFGKLVKKYGLTQRGFIA